MKNFALFFVANEIGNRVADAGTLLQTVLMGFSTVFVGLMCIIFICKLMGIFVRTFTKNSEVAPMSAQDVIPAPATENRNELAAVIACAVAEELGTDVDGIRIVSIKKIN